MDPETHRLDPPPRSNQTDAFFEADRSSTAAMTTTNQFELDAKGKDRAGIAPTSVSFPVFRSKHVVDALWEPNPLPHARKTTPTKNGAIDPDIAGWKHDVAYTCFFSSAARTLSAISPDQARLQVKLLFGTGSEYYRHGVCGAVENAVQPTLLIVIGGIEPQHKIKFWNPARPSETRELYANNRWGVGITTASIEKAITRRYGRLVNYDISICAAFSTGYLGLQDSIVRKLFPVDRLDRVIFYDCLYGSLKPALQQVKALKNSVQIIAYVVTENGNSFQSARP